MWIQQYKWKKFPARYKIQDTIYSVLQRSSIKNTVFILHVKNWKKMHKQSQTRQNEEKINSNKANGVLNTKNDP